MSDAELLKALDLSVAQWDSVKEAATDASMPLRDYIRLMLLCAAGHGGVIEHAERAVAASWEADGAK